MSSKVEVTKDYLNDILQALEDAKGLCVVYRLKHGFNKHINKTKYYIKRVESKEFVERK